MKKYISKLGRLGLISSLSFIVAGGLASTFFYAVKNNESNNFQTKKLNKISRIVHELQI